MRHLAQSNSTVVEEPDKYNIECTMLRNKIGMRISGTGYNQVKKVCII